MLCAYAAKFLFALALSVNSPSRYLQERNAVVAENEAVIICHQKLFTMKKTVIIPHVLKAVNRHFVVLLKVNIRGQVQEIVKKEDYNFTNLITSYLNYRKRK